MLCSADPSQQEDASDEESDAQYLEAVLAQCLYILFGLDLHHRDSAWGGDVEVCGPFLFLPTNDIEYH